MATTTLILNILPLTITENPDASEYHTQILRKLYNNARTYVQARASRQKRVLQQQKYPACIETTYSRLHLRMILPPIEPCTYSVGKMPTNSKHLLIITPDKKLYTLGLYTALKASLIRKALMASYKNHMVIEHMVTLGVTHTTSLYDLME